MEVKNSEQGHLIEVSADISNAQTPQGKRICSGAVCGFADATTSSKDAQERSASMRKLLMAVVLCVLFMSVEVVGGIKANSLAILTDAAHLLSDVAAFAISLFSLWASGWEATPRQSYGFFRIEILGALVSIQMIWLLAGILVYEAIVRIIHETGEVNGFLMFAVAAFGLVVNILMAFLLGHDHGHGHGHGGHDHGHGGHGHGHGHGGHGHGHGHGGHGHGHGDGGRGHGHGHGGHSHGHSHDHEGHKGKHSHDITITSHHHSHGESPKDQDHHHHAHDSAIDQPLLEGRSDCNAESKSKSTAKQNRKRNINVQGAYLHVLGDSIQSIGVMISGGIIWFRPEWKIIDLICTLFFSVIVLGTTINMLRNILEVLMESTPREIDATKLEQGLCQLEEVLAIHELHIWAITVGKVLLACHVKITPESDADAVLDKVIEYIQKEYNISHVTIQIER